jgi:8-oxo-dGTP pyrophosphatase MutT (NUDIX family)
VLDLDPTRAAAAPRDAATILALRDRDGGEPEGADVEVFCVERNKKSRFMGGALVFPGGKLDEADRDDTWTPLATAPRHGRGTFAPDEATLRALCIAACRETLEEAALLLLDERGGGMSHDGFTVDDAEVRALRTKFVKDAGALRAWLAARSRRIDLGALVPFARWITPVAEPRRYDTRFFLTRAPEGQSGAHDEHETMASFWATPRAILERFGRGEVQLAPPTHRSLEILASVRSVAAAFELAERACLDPICPKLIQQTENGAQLLALALPGDPEHEVREPRVAGPSRFVLRGERWHAENAP